MNVLTVGRSKSLLYEFPVHKHGYWELVYNYEGNGIMTINSTEIPFDEGEMVIIPPGVVHGKSAEKGFMDLSMIIKDMRPVGVSKAHKIIDDRERSLFKLMDMAEKVYMNPGNYSEKHNTAILNALGEAIYQIMSGLFDAGLKRDFRIESFIKCLETNLSNPDYNIAEEIEKTGYSEGYLRKVFKRELGMSPLQYFNKMRIEHAKELILLYGPSRAFKDIALECGFTDPYYFSRVFKNVMGMSPSEYVIERKQFDMKNVDGDNLRADLHRK